MLYHERLDNCVFFEISEFLCVIITITYAFDPELTHFYKTFHQCLTMANICFYIMKTLSLIKMTDMSSVHGEAQEREGHVFELPSHVHVKNTLLNAS